ncbi:MAG TPA: hypothetical protein VIL85_24100 [Thermomicrobiales bacterium]|jgi:hypothetical protein
MGLDEELQAQLDENPLDYGLEKANYVAPDVLTWPCEHFLHEHARIRSFIQVLASSARHADLRWKEIAQQQLGNNADPSDSAAPPKELWDWFAEEGMGSELMLIGQRGMIMEMVLCRSVDNFLAYVTELMALVFQTRPQMLKAAEAGEPLDTVPLDLVLQHQNMDDLIQALTERRVDQLSRRGMRDLLKYWSKRMGFRLLETTEAVDRMVCLIEQRNVIVHNRAVVNRIFLSKVPNSPATIGERLHLASSDVYADLGFLAGSICGIDSRAIAHFDLPHRKLPKGEFA